ncbi:MAG: metallophosphoesterase [Minicystis sp.]
MGFALAWMGAPHPGWLAVVIASIGVALLGGRLRRARSDGPIPRWRVLLVEEPYYAHWCATVAAWPLLLIAALGVMIHAAVTSTRDLGARLGAAALGAYGAALVISTYGVAVRRRWVRVRTIDVPVAGLGAAFDGYRIAHLSDLHVGGLWPRRRAEGWIARVRDLDVDLVALTGDYVTHGNAFHDDVAAVLGALRGRDGAVAVMGNHDYFGDAEPLVARIRARGVTMLRNEHLSLARGADAITIAGVDDTWTRRADVRAALTGAPAGQPIIALAHDPQLFPELARRGAAVVLSGHTHWGQIAVPFLPTRLNLSRLSYRLHAGTYRAGGAVLYVSPGLGTTGPPIRLGAPPEITVLRLRRAERA